MLKDQMDKIKVGDCSHKAQPISCAIHGSKACPKPTECDGVHRLCDFWKICSGR